MCPFLARILCFSFLTLEKFLEKRNCSLSSSDLFLLSCFLYLFSVLKWALYESSMKSAISGIKYFWFCYSMLSSCY